METTFRSRWIRFTAIASCVLGTCLALHSMMKPGTELPGYVVEIGLLKLLYGPTAWAVGEEPGFGAWCGQLIAASLLWGTMAGWLLARLNAFLRLSIGLAAFNFLGCAALFTLAECIDDAVFEAFPEPVLLAIVVVAFYIPFFLLALPLGGHFLLGVYGWDVEFSSPLALLLGEDSQWILFAHAAVNALIWGLLVATAIRLIVRRRTALGLVDPPLPPVSPPCPGLA